MKLKKSTIYMMANPIAYGVRVIPVTGWVLDEHPELAIVRQLPNKDGLINTDFWDLACRDSGRVLKRGRRGESKQHLADNSKKEIESYYKQRNAGKFDERFKEHKDAMEEAGYTVRKKTTPHGRQLQTRIIGQDLYSKAAVDLFITEMRRLGYEDTVFKLREVNTDEFEILTCAKPQAIGLMEVCLAYIEAYVRRDNDGR